MLLYVWGQNVSHPIRNFDQNGERIVHVRVKTYTEWGRRLEEKIKQEDQNKTKENETNKQITVMLEERKTKTRLGSYQRLATLMDEVV